MGPFCNNSEMAVFKIMITATTVALASAWSTQIPNFYHAFAPSTPSALPIPFRTFFHDSSLQSRFYLHQPQFRQPMHLFQPPNVRLTSLQLTRPHPLPPPPYSIPIQSHLLPSQMDPLSLPASLRQDAITADEQHHHHHHHHVFYYYYFPANDETRIIADGSNKNRGTRQPCNDNPAPIVGCAPAYLPPQPPLPPVTNPITTTTQSPPPIQLPCDDDTVVVDNVNYFPFGRAPIVVAPTATTVADNGHSAKEYAGSSNNSYRGHSQPTSNPENKSNFILANYLLPPDK